MTIQYTHNPCIYTYLVGLSEKHPKCPKSRRFQHPVVKQRFEQVSQQTESDKMHMALHPPSRAYGMVLFA